MDVDVGVVADDRADVAFVDLVLIGSVAAVANKNRASELLVKHAAHLALQPDDHVEIGDVNDVVSVEFLLLVDGRRSRSALQQRNDLLFLQAASDVALGPSFIGRDVGNGSLDAGERGMGALTKEGCYPTVFTLNDLRAILVGILCVREQDADRIKAVFGSMLQEASFQGAKTLSISDNGLELIMRQNVLSLGLGRLVKYIFLHD